MASFALLAAGTLAGAACGGETASVDCESPPDKGSCEQHPSCVWLYNEPAPDSPNIKYPDTAKLPPACFERSRTGAGAVCSASETKLAFHSGPCWTPVCNADEVQPDDSVTVCWRNDRR